MGKHMKHARHPKAYHCRCERCGAEFMGSVPWQRFCSTECNRAAYRERNIDKKAALDRARRLRAYSEKNHAEGGRGPRRVDKP